MNADSTVRRATLVVGKRVGALSIAELDALRARCDDIARERGVRFVAVVVAATIDDGDGEISAIYGVEVGSKGTDRTGRFPANWDDALHLAGAQVESAVAAAKALDDAHWRRAASAFGDGADLRDEIELYLVPTGRSCVAWVRTPSGEEIGADEPELVGPEPGDFSLTVEGL